MLLEQFGEKFNDEKHIYGFSPAGLFLMQEAALNTSIIIHF